MYVCVVLRVVHDHTTRLCHATVLMLQIWIHPIGEWCACVRVFCEQSGDINYYFVHVV